MLPLRIGVGDHAPGLVDDRRMAFAAEGDRLLEANEVGRRHRGDRHPVGRQPAVDEQHRIAALPRHHRAEMRRRVLGRPQYFVQSRRKRRPRPFRHEDRPRGRGAVAKGDDNEAIDAELARKDFRRRGQRLAQTVAGLDEIVEGRFQIRCIALERRSDVFREKQVLFTNRL